MNPAKCNYLTNVRENRLSLPFFPDRASTPISVPNLAKDLGLQLDNVYSLPLLSALTFQIRQDDLSSQ